MKQVFMISGLPRSRTAWLANFMTAGQSFCYHEVTKFCRTMPEIAPLIRRSQSVIVGNSGSDGPFIYRAVLRAFPNIRGIIIDRDAGDVQASLKAVGLPASNELMDVLINRHEAMKTETKWPIIKYEDIDMDSCRTIYDHCIEDGGFCEKRWEMLDAMSIQYLARKTDYSKLKEFGGDLCL